jgi:hypothetical protein
LKLLLCMARRWGTAFATSAFDQVVVSIDHATIQNWSNLHENERTESTNNMMTLMCDALWTELSSFV